MPDAEPFFDTNVVLYVLSDESWRKGKINLSLFLRYVVTLAGNAGVHGQGWCRFELDWAPPWPWIPAVHAGMMGSKQAQMHAELRILDNQDPFLRRGMNRNAQNH